MKSNYPILEFTLLGISLLFLGYALTSMLDSPLQENGMLGKVNLSVIQDTTLLPFSPPPQRFQSLGTLIERIIQAESGGNPKAKNPDSSAYGLCQFIDGTWEYVQDKWSMELNRDSEIDQRYACERLLNEEGTKHWQESKNCWQ